MKYKAGDIVFIKGADDWGISPGFCTGMKKYIGKIATITSTVELYYRIDIDGGEWFWGDHMFCRGVVFQ